MFQEKGQDGAFLFRKRSSETEDLILTVIFGGKITHHLVYFEDGMIHVNNNCCRAVTTLDDVGYEFAAVTSMSDALIIVQRQGDIIYFSVLP